MCVNWCHAEQTNSDQTIVYLRSSNRRSANRRNTQVLITLLLLGLQTSIIYQIKPCVSGKGLDPLILIFEDLLKVKS